MHIGIIGCGQLARMLALSGWNMGLEFSFLANRDEPLRSVRGLGAVTRLQPGFTAEQVYEALGKPDIVTVERENVDLELLRGLAEHCAVHPNPDAVQTCGDRALEKSLLDRLGLPTAPYRIADSAGEVAVAAGQLGLPLVVKATTSGYDGKAQWRLQDPAQLRAFCDQDRPGRWLVESRIDFLREVSLLAARSATGDIVLYPPTDNHHRDGVLLTSVAPAEALPADLLADGCDYLRALLKAMDYVGVLAMECFVTADGLLINELAPRVHNSGHWTLHSEATSQFENHLRAILGMNLGSTQVSRYNGIINILGPYDREGALRALSRDATLTDYNKTVAPLRKLGHINVSRSRREDILGELERLRHSLYSDRGRPGDPTTAHQT